MNTLPAKSFYLSIGAPDISELWPKEVDPPVNARGRDDEVILKTKKTGLNYRFYYGRSSNRHFIYNFERQNCGVFKGNLKKKLKKIYLLVVPHVQGQLCQNLWTEFICPYFDHVPSFTSVRRSLLSKTLACNFNFNPNTGWLVHSGTRTTQRQHPHANN